MSDVHFVSCTMSIFQFSLLDAKMLVSPPVVKPLKLSVRTLLSRKIAGKSASSEIPSYHDAVT